MISIYFLLKIGFILFLTHFVPLLGKCLKKTFKQYLQQISIDISKSFFNSQMCFHHLKMTTRLGMQEMNLINEPFYVNTVHNMNQWVTSSTGVGLGVYYIPASINCFRSSQQRRHLLLSTHKWVSLTYCEHFDLPFSRDRIVLSILTHCCVLFTAFFNVVNYFFNALRVSVVAFDEDSMV